MPPASWNLSVSDESIFFIKKHRSSTRSANYSTAEKRSETYGSGTNQIACRGYDGITMGKRFSQHKNRAVVAKSDFRDMMSRNVASIAAR